MRMILQAGNNIIINNRSFIGKNISIINDKVIIDGVEQEGFSNVDINITVEGDVQSIENTSGTIIANEVGKINTVSGDVKCTNVSGSVSTISGDIQCGNVTGSVTTVSGDIRHR